MPIFDQGYQHWSGKLAGHSWRWLTIARHGVRIGKKNRYLRLLVLVAWMPAIVLVFFLCLWGLVEQKSQLIEPFMPMLRFLPQAALIDPLSYRVEVWTIFFSYFLWVELRLSMLLIVLVGPDLISQDLRFNALPLYFSRPLRRSDYFLGKLGVIVAFLSMVIIVPSLIAYVLGLVFSLDISIVLDTFGILLAVVAYGLLIAVSAGLLILALSSLSRNSRYVALIWLCLWLVGGTTASILEGINEAQLRHQAWQGRGNMAGQAYAARLFEAKEIDWRPLVSYQANLSRIGQQLLRTDACWQRLSETLLGRFQNQNMIYQRRGLNALYAYPWYWSAAVLAVLGGLSIWILYLSVKSLDRLK